MKNIKLNFNVVPEKYIRVSTEDISKEMSVSLSYTLDKTIRVNALKAYIDHLVITENVKDPAVVKKELSPIINAALSNGELELGSAKEITSYIDSVINDYNHGSTIVNKTIMSFEAMNNVNASEKELFAEYQESKDRYDAACTALLSRYENYTKSISSEFIAKYNKLFNYTFNV